MVMLPQVVFAAAGLVNGSFELGYQGWTLDKDATDASFATATTLRSGQFVDAGNNLMDYVDHMSVANYSTGLPLTGEPTDGLWQALFLQNGPSTTHISQIVELTKYPELSFDLAYHNWDDAFSSAQTFQVQIRDADTDALLGTVFTTSGATTAAMSHYAFELSAFGEMTVRLQFELAAQTTYFDVQLDNIHLANVPPAQHACPTCEHVATDMAGEQPRDLAEYPLATGGCSTGGGSGLLVAFAAFGLVWNRRRRR